MFQYLEKRFSLTVRIIITLSYIFVTVSKMKYLVYKRKLTFHLNLDFLYSCYFIWTKFSSKSSNWFTYMVSSWIMWTYLYIIYKYCMYFKTVFFFKISVQKMIIIGWNESSYMDRCNTNGNDVSWSYFIDYFWYDKSQIQIR